MVCTLGQEEENNVASDLNMGSEVNMKLGSENKEYDNLLNIKIFSGNNKYHPMYLIILFLQFDSNFLPTKSVIKIGRSPDCEISIDDNMLSRLHCTIEYRENFGWIIRDGFLVKLKDGSYESKNSTNGTW